MVALGAHRQARRPLRNRRRVAGAVAVPVVLVRDVMYTSSNVSGVLVDSILHLTEDVVKLDQIFLRPGVGQIVLLSQGVGNRSMGTVSNTRASWLRHVRLGNGHASAVGDGKSPVKRQQRSSNLAIRRRVDLAALYASKEIIHHVVRALTICAIVVVMMGVVAKMLRALVVHGRLIEVKAIVCRWLRGIVRGMRVLVSKVARVPAHLTIVIVVARSFSTCQ